MTQNIAVIAANGKSGQLIVREAVDRGLDVTAVVRGENKTVARHAIIKDLFDLTAADLTGFDVVVDAFGAWTPGTLPQHSTSLKHLADVLSGADARLIVVGGAGSLYVNPEHAVQLSQTDGFPEAFLPLATAVGIRVIAWGGLRSSRLLRRCRCSAAFAECFTEYTEFSY
nr:NAD(P)H-binding protein [Bifidobacterium longum]